MSERDELQISMAAPELLKDVNKNIGFGNP